MVHFISRIHSNAVLCEGMYEMVFSWNDDKAIPLPGQFCTVRVSQGVSPLLRRPFAFSAFDPKEKTASIIYKKIGPATELLAGKSCGDALDVIGPLGNSFSGIGKTENSILVAGGTGIGPIFLWNHMLRQQRLARVMVLGSPSQTGIPKVKISEEESMIICTEDGSRGFRGTVVDYLRNLPADRFKNATLYCCGPSGMLKACHDLSLDHGIDCFVSMEQIMACGVGACMGCAVKIKGDPGFARVCREGPIFSSRTIAWT
jgi:dihydroorotate dehydrogenase electron transfer subunit